jgi:hypothetical protein
MHIIFAILHVCIIHDISSVSIYTYTIYSMYKASVSLCAQYAFSSVAQAQSVERSSAAKFKPLIFQLDSH